MNTITIRDLPQMKELDAQAMADTSGGFRWFLPYRRVALLLPRPVAQNNVDFGSGNNFAGINLGVNNGTVSGNTFNF